MRFQWRKSNYLNNMNRKITNAMDFMQHLNFDRIAFFIIEYL